MKRWHFKKWVQTTLEVITAIYMVLLLGVSNVNEAFGWVILIALLAVASLNVFLLRRFGNYD